MITIQKKKILTLPKNFHHAMTKLIFDDENQILQYMPIQIE